MSARTDTRGRRVRWGTAEERFAARYTDVDGCWEWDVPHPVTGYGTIWDTDAGKNVLAHRWSYERHVAPITDGMQIDHLCRNRSCVNPEHLEPVTPGENSRRGFWGFRTHCLHGHEFTPENTRRDRRGYRGCRECKRITERKYRSKGKAS